MQELVNGRYLLADQLENGIGAVRADDQVVELLVVL